MEGYTGTMQDITISTNPTLTFLHSFLVEDHFAKALGDTWLKLKAKEKDGGSSRKPSEGKKTQLAAI